MSNGTVKYFTVKEGRAKLARLAQVAFAHFEKKEKLIFFVPDEATLHFVDTLLWRFPEESFLPHLIAQDKCDALIALTAGPNNVNAASAAFNLCTSPLLQIPFKTIYEFEDLTAPEKKAAFEIRYRAYKEAQYVIVNDLSY